MKVLAMYENIFDTIHNIIVDHNERKNKITSSDVKKISVLAKSLFWIQQYKPIPIGELICLNIFYIKIICL